MLRAFSVSGAKKQGPAKSRRQNRKGAKRGAWLFDSAEKGTADAAARRFPREKGLIVHKRPVFLRLVL